MQGPAVPEQLIRRDAVEFSVVHHCNLRCAGCDHLSPWLKPDFSSLDSFALDIELLSRVMHVHRLNLLGGEPLLHPQLLEFIAIAKASRLADQVAVWTNGVALHIMNERFYELVDILYVTIYPGTRVQMSIDRLRALASVHGFKLKIHKKTKFQHAFVNDRVADVSTTQQIYDACAKAHSWSCHSFGDGMYYKCSVAATIPKRLAVLKKTLPDGASDGVKLRNNNRLKDDLIAYLSSPKPLEACSWCLGTSGKQFPHYQLNAKELRLENSGEAIPLENLLASSDQERSRRLHSLPLVMMKKG